MADEKKNRPALHATPQTAQRPRRRPRRRARRRSKEQDNPPQPYPTQEQLDTAEGRRADRAGRRREDEADDCRRRVASARRRRPKKNGQVEPNKPAGGAGYTDPLTRVLAFTPDSDPRRFARPPRANIAPGPYLLRDGWLSATAGQYWNWWQMGYNVQPYSVGSAMVEACVSAYAQTVAMCPGDHWRLLPNGGRERQTTATSALARILRTPNATRRSPTS